MRQFIEQAPTGSMNICDNCQGHIPDEDIFSFGKMAICRNCNTSGRFQPKAAGDKLLAIPSDSALEVTLLPNGQIEVVSDPLTKGGMLVLFIVLGAMINLGPFAVSIWLGFKVDWLMALLALFFVIPFWIFSTIILGIIYSIIFRKQKLLFNSDGLTIESKYGFWTRKKVFKRVEILAVRMVQVETPRPKVNRTNYRWRTTYMRRIAASPMLVTATENESYSLERTHQLLKYDSEPDQAWLVAQLRYTFGMS